MSSFPPAFSSSDPSSSPPAALPHTATATAATAAPASPSSPPELFPRALISPAVAAALPPGYTMRPLRASDHGAGFLDVLRVLTAVGDVGAAAWRKRFDEMCSARGTYYVLVVCDAGGARAGGGGGEGEGEGRIVGTGAVVVERKFIRGLGCVGHIEDIAVARDQQGMKLGLRIIEALDWLAAEVGCYKTILDCSEANEGFYLKCGFRRAGLEMAHYHQETGGGAAAAAAAAAAAGAAAASNKEAGLASS